MKSGYAYSKKKKTNREKPLNNLWNWASKQPKYPPRKQMMSDTVMGFNEVGIDTSEKART